MNPVLWKLSVTLALTALVAPQWTLKQKLEPPYDGSRAFYGSVLVADGTTLAVADVFAGPWGSSGPAGAVYLYRRQGSWVLDARIDNPSTSPQGPSFGWSAALKGSLLAVGDPLTFPGRVHLFTRQRNGKWTFASTVTSPDPTWTRSFGDFLSTDGMTLAVHSRYWNGISGYPDRVYVFDVRDPAEPLLATRLEPSPQRDSPFGECTAVSGDLLAVSDRLSDSTGFSGSGVVHLYRHTTAGWTLDSILSPNDPQSSAQFGCGLQLEGLRIAVGAPGYSTLRPAVGAVYVFDQDSSGAWQQSARLTPADDTPLGWFGSPLSLSGNRLVAGASLSNIAGFYSGAAYVFDRDRRTGAWSASQRLLPEPAFEGLRFGLATALTDDTVFVNAPYDHVGGRERGTVVVYRNRGANGS